MLFRQNPYTYIIIRINFVVEKCRAPKWRPVNVELKYILI